jgi:hypothetical protein
MMCASARLFGNEDPIEVRVASDDRVKTEALKKSSDSCFRDGQYRWVSLQGAQMEKFEAGTGQSS